MDLVRYRSGRDGPPQAVRGSLEGCRIAEPRFGRIGGRLLRPDVHPQFPQARMGALLQVVRRERSRAGPPEEPGRHAEGFRGARPSHAFMGRSPRARDAPQLPLSAIREESVRQRWNGDSPDVRGDHSFIRIGTPSGRPACSLLHGGARGIRRWKLAMGSHRSPYRIVLRRTTCPSRAEHRLLPGGLGCRLRVLPRSQRAQRRERGPVPRVRWQRHEADALGDGRVVQRHGQGGPRPGEPGPRRCNHGRPSRLPLLPFGRARLSGGDKRRPEPLGAGNIQGGVRARSGSMRKSCAIRPAQHGRRVREGDGFGHAQAAGRRHHAPGGHHAPGDGRRHQAFSLPDAGELRAGHQRLRPVRGSRLASGQHRQGRAARPRGAGDDYQLVHDRERGKPGPVHDEPDPQAAVASVRPGDQGDADHHRRRGHGPHDRHHRRPDDLRRVVFLQHPGPAEGYRPAARGVRLQRLAQHPVPSDGHVPPASASVRWNTDEH